MNQAVTLQQLHERLCFSRAFPRTASELHRAERALAGFERRVARLRSELDNTGIAGTVCRYPYNHAMATWLAARYGRAVRIDWQAYQRHAWDEVAALLSLAVVCAENEGLDDDDVPSREWIAQAKASRAQTDLQWLLARLKGLGFDPEVERHLYEGLSLQLVWDLSGCPDAVTHARLPVERVFYHRGPFLGRPADFAAEARRPVGELERLAPELADRVVDAARAALSQREREFHVIVHANRDEVYRIAAGRGLEIFLFGLAKPLRLTLEADYGALLVKNGVPIGYGYSALLFDRADLAINIFPTYRAGESAWVFSRFAGVFHQHFGSRVLVMRRTQVGYKNPEGIEAGSFWFYYKLGFRPVSARVRRLAEAEAARLAAGKGTRSDDAMLRRLAASDLVLCLDGTGPESYREVELKKAGLAVTRLIEGRFGGDRARALRELARRTARALGEPRLASATVPRLVPVVALIPDLARWSQDDRRLVAAAVLAKEGRRERPYVLAMRRARRFGHFLETRFRSR